MNDERKTVPFTPVPILFGPVIAYRIAAEETGGKPDVRARSGTVGMAGEAGNSDRQAVRKNRRHATGYYQSPAGVGSTLQKVAAGWIERLADHTQLHYDTAGRLERIVSVSGDTWTLSFANLSGQERLRSVLDPFGRRTTLSYDGAGYLSRVTDAAGRESQFTVDAQGQLTQYVTPELCVHELSYDEQGRLAAYADPEGNRFSYTYDAVGRLESYENPLGARTTYTYSPLQNEIQCKPLTDAQSRGS